MDYMGIQQLLASMDSATAAEQLYQQNPTVNPTMLLPQLKAFSAEQQASAAGSDAGMLSAPTKTPAGGIDWAKMLSGAKGMATAQPAASPPRIFAPTNQGSNHLAKASINLPGGAQYMDTSFGQYMGARKRG